MRFRRLTSATAIVLSLVCSSPAAWSQGGEKISIRCMALNNEPMPEMKLMTTDGLVTLDFSPIQPTAAVRARFANPLPLYGPGSAPGKKDGPPPVTVKLPADAKEILLLSWISGETTSYLAIKDDFSSSGRDDWLLINTTGTPIAIQVGKETQAKRVGPGAYEPFKIVAPANEGAAVTAAVLRDKKWHPIYETYWPIYADKRNIVLFVADGKKIRVRPVWDQLSPPAAPTR
jgi:hypothetical protein